MVTQFYEGSTGDQFSRFFQLFSVQFIFCRYKFAWIVVFLSNVAKKNSKGNFKRSQRIISSNDGVVFKRHLIFFKIDFLEVSSLTFSD